jgi:membrane-associated phospholipid phosphatase
LKKLVIVLAVFFAALLVIASFFDLQIDEYIYNPQSAFARFFAIVGMFPQDALLLLAPAMILAALFELRRTIKAAVTAAAGVAVILVTAASLYYNLPGIAQGTGISLTIVTAVVCFLILVFFLAALPFAKKKPGELLITALIGFIAFNVGYLILQTLKTTWGRMRFYKMDDPAVQFTKWYIPQGKSASDTFKSFPSGHSFSGMCAVWFALWYNFIDALKKYSPVILAAALLFGFSVMLSRMIYGRHFLSDVTVGAALSLASFALAKSLVTRVFRKI